MCVCVREREWEKREGKGRERREETQRITEEGEDNNEKKEVNNEL